MAARNRLPVQLDQNDHMRLKKMSQGTGIGMNGIIHGLLRCVSEKCNYVLKDKISHLPRYVVFELIHLLETDVIDEEEFNILAFNKAADGIALDMVWADSISEKRDILDIYDIKNNRFV